MLTGRSEFIGPFETRVFRQLEAVYFEVQRTPGVMPGHVQEQVDMSAQIKSVFRAMKAAGNQDKNFVS